MSAATVAMPASAGADKRPGIGRLTYVELRKMIDTRAGFWVIAGAFALALVIVVANGLLSDADSERDLLASIEWALFPLSVLGPVIGVLLVTSEWSQRTALVTFALVPQRWRIVTAKLLAAIVVGIGFMLAAVVLGALATALFGGANRWDYSATIFAQSLLMLVLKMLMGVGFGAMLLVSAPAIVLFFVLPLAWTMVGSVPALEGAAGWLDTSSTMGPMLSEALSSDEWARLAVSCVVWVLIPLVIGIWRIGRADVK